MTSPSHAGRRPRHEYLVIERAKAFEQFHKERYEHFEEVSKNIDFQKFGWVTIAAHELNMPPQKVRKWMKKFFPELLKNAFTRG
jgi:hypothetical protein